MLDKPIVRGTRLTVELLLLKISQGVMNMLAMYLHLSQDDIQVVLNYAADLLANQELMEVSA